MEEEAPAHFQNGVFISDESLLVKYKHYYGQKSRAMTAVLLLMLPLIVILLALVFFPFFKILSLTLLAMGIIFPLLYLLLKVFIHRAEVNEGTWKETAAEDKNSWKMDVFRGKGEHSAPFKLRFENDTLTWYPRFNSEAHVDIARSDIQEIDFGWGAFELMSPLLAEAWKISYHAVQPPHAVPVTREDEAGWISVVFKENVRLTSKWTNPYKHWIDPHNENIVNGGILIMEKGFDMSYKQIKLISDTFENQFDLPVKRFDQIAKKNYFA